jgi:uncharacterized protein YjcR
MIAKGRVARGLQQVGNRKLTIEQVREIRKSYKPGVKGYGHKSLAKKYNTSPRNIRSILNRTSWWYVEDDSSTVEEIH